MKFCVRKEMLIGVLIISVILGMAVIIPASGTEKNRSADYAETQDAKNGYKYTSHGPISINGNNDFASQASTEGWAGDGTKNNPYIIENYDINASLATGVWPRAGIKIKKTDIYFIIIFYNIWIIFCAITSPTLGTCLGCKIVIAIYGDWP
ncbi:MAG: hypothetical protein KJ886_04675, partial [Candidatus Thermoplasmatota archaeon]|nr:hypothetical protein [Candidatus Thermoplasmatota archaeon]